MISLENTSAASAIAGLQYIGTVSGSTTISGTVNNPGGSALVASFNLEFYNENIISLVRFQAPSNGGQIPNYWYPISSSLDLLDETAGASCDIWVSVTSSAIGRQVNIQIVNNMSNAAFTFSNWTFNAVAELYQYPF